MREVLIHQRDAGQRLDKFLRKYLSEAPSSFIYKMLRKKNITLNGAKADGSEKIQENDVVKFFLSDETMDKFRTPVVITTGKKENMLHFDQNWILYEDEEMLFVNKPSGVLSQKAKPGDVSMNEIMIDYLANNGTISMEELRTFKPSVCNRLDRNTSGILSFGKTLRGTQYLTEGFRERRFEKYYLCVVHGVIKVRAVVDGYLVKNEKTNKVTVTGKQSEDEAERIITEYIPVADNGRETFLKIRLHTGKTHQIRAHLASIGHPLIGDYKYGDGKWNDVYRKKYGIKDQLLHAFELNLSDKDLHIVASMPKEMCQFLKGEKLWEPGNQGDLEDLH
ncbi:MAG: RluA family pseudouridine synthase [Lachnospiraceae bacterium]